MKIIAVVVVLLSIKDKMTFAKIVIFKSNIKMKFYPNQSYFSYKFIVY